MVATPVMPAKLDPPDTSLLVCRFHSLESQLSPSTPVVNLEKLPRSFEGVVALAGTLAGTLYMATAHSISGAMAWVLFLVSIASFVLSIFAAARQSRWWFVLTAFAFALILIIASSTEGCTINPCPL